jgi:hypothetical protein
MKAGRQPGILGRRPMRASEKQKPRWFWTGVMPLDGMEDDSRLRELVAMLPARKSSDREILAYLVDLRARFPRWMHQDEFGPDRGEQTAALRALMESCRALQKHLLQRSSTFKAPLDATLRARSSPNSLVLEAFYEAAGDVAQEWRSNGASHRDTVWIAQLQDRVYELMVQSQALDTNTDGELFLTAAKRKFDVSQITGLDFCLADVECWLNSYETMVATERQRSFRAPVVNTYPAYTAQLSQRFRSDGSPTMAVLGFPALQPATEMPASPWDRPELF